MKKAFNSFLAFLLFLLSMFSSIAICEFAMRMYDKFSGQWKDIPVFNTIFKSSSIAADKLDAYLNGLPLSTGMDLKWFYTTPPPLPPKKIDPFYIKLLKKVEGKEPAKYGMVFKELNIYRVKDILKNKGPQFDFLMQFPQEAVVFEPCEKTIYPAYRFPQSVTLPDGLTTNNFGWRGLDLELNKPPDTIRISFIGASTTIGVHSFPYSYPECIGHWLNLWAKQNNIPVKFEIINAGREGITSTDIAAIFKQEVVPVEPDIVVYYEASNQFEFYPLINIKEYNLPKPTLLQRISLLLEKTSDYSALVKRIHELYLHLFADVFGREPFKPLYVINMPKDVDENNPNINSSNLPLNLPIILKDLDLIHEEAKRISCSLYLVSFAWLPYEGMVLNPVRHKAIYNIANKFYWPLTYADLKRLGDFQNTVFKRYAEERGINFIDFAKIFPKDPDLFIDVVHLNEIGIRLQAWIIMQELIKEIQHKIICKDLPRPDQFFLKEHPCISPKTKNSLGLILNNSN